MRKNTRNRKSERGIALIVALLALLLISVIALGMMTSANTELSISANFRDEQIAFFSARGGLDEVRDRLRGTTPNTLFFSLPTAMPGAPNGVVYVTDGSATPWLSGSTYADKEICHEGVNCPLNGNWYNQTVGSPAYAANPPLTWRWVRINWKTDNGTYSVDGTPSFNPVCWLGSGEQMSATGCDPVNNPQVYMLTALSVTNSGSRRMVQYEVAKMAIPPMPGALVFDGPNPTFNVPNSNPFQVSGLDAHQGVSGQCTTKKTDKAALGGYGAAAKVALTADIGQTRPQNYVGSSGLTPDVQDVYSSLYSLTSVDGLQSMVNNITSIADHVYPTSNPSNVNLGTPQTPMINVIQGDYTLSGSTTGTGVLLVTGTLTLSGAPNFNGDILVIGKGKVVKNGGGNGVVNGSLFVANLYDSNGHLIPTGADPANPPGSPSVDWNGGGTATFQYDSCWTQDLTQKVPYKILATREQIY